MGSDGNYYVGNTNWHSDSGFKPRGLNVKIALYLDPVARNSGCLRVIPGSHRVGEAYAEQIHKDIWRCKDNWGVEGSDVPCVALETQPGDVLIFNHDIKHASFFGSTNRRMFTINCCQRYADDDLPRLREYVASYARFWVDSPIGEPMIRTATPQRRRHLEQLLANCDHLPALSAKAREEMPEPARG